MNKAILVGRLTKDPEIKKMQNGNSVVNFSIAINRNFKNANGDYDADFINCVAFNRTADFIASYFNKGSLVGIDGRIQTRSYENQQGQRVFVTEVIAENVQFVGPKATNAQSNQTIQNSTSQPTNNDFFADFNQNNNSSEDILSGLDISDDELPF